MSYTALYRKFRPQSFDEVKGQDHIVKTLKNQASAGRIGHAYLFCGTRGTGKTTIAKILARTVNCENPTENGPCNECESCRAILAGRSANVIEIDAASNNGVDNIRGIREEVAYHPTQGRYKVYIIDEVHMLSTGAFNALLKTLEEPPEYVIFILATTEVSKIPVTILSRCQQYHFHRITIDTIADRLGELLGQENVQSEEKALRYIAKAADGSMRDALSLLEQCISFYLGETLTYEKVLSVLGTIDTDVFSRMLRTIASGDVPECLRILHGQILAGKEMGQFVNDFSWYLRNLLLVQSGADTADMLEVSAENLRQLKEESAMIGRNTLMRYIRIFSELSGEVKLSAQKQILVETALIRLCQPQMDVDLTALHDRVKELEKKLEEGVFAQASPPARSEDPSQKKPENTAEAKEQPPAKAAPEDVIRAVDQWDRVKRMAHPMLRSFLEQAEPRYDSRTGGNKLFLETADATACRFLNDETRKTELQEHIRECIGKLVETEALIRGTKDSLSAVPPIEELRKRVRIAVEEDDEEIPEEFPDIGF